MSHQYAILVDGGFLLKSLGKKLRHFPDVSDIVTHCDQIMSNSKLKNSDLLRIYFYHAPPSTLELTNPIDKSKLCLSKSAHFKDSARLLESLPFTILQMQAMLSSLEPELRRTATLLDTLELLLVFSTLNPDNVK